MVQSSETERLEALRRYEVLDSPSEQSYDDLTELASFICDTPVALISFVDQDRQWFKSATGIGVQETPRSQSFCAYTIPTGETLVVPDALQDVRFSGNPLVQGDPSIRFYAGAPIIEKDGHVLGSICVIDNKPRNLSPKQVSALEALARQVVVLLEQRRTISALHEAAAVSKAADRVIQDSERRLRVFVDSLPALAWIADADGYITWYNRRWYEYTGTTPAQMEGWGWQSVHDPEVLPSVLERWTGSIKSGESFDMVFPLRGADGVFRPFLTRIVPLRNETGTITEWFGTNVEVDALQKAQLALERNQAVLSQVLTVTTDAILTVNRDWTLAYFNPKAAELYGLEADCLGENLWRALPLLASTDTPFFARYQAAMQDQVASSFEVEFGPPQNFTIGAEVYPTETGIVAFSRDITKLKHAAAAVLQNEKLAAVGRLASSIAHEINNPLEAVTNLLFLARTTEKQDDTRAYLISADAELRRVAAITSQTLRFHRQSTKAREVSFAELIDGVFTGFHSRLRNHRIQVSERDTTTERVWCFEGEIRQVLINLISNAIDAMHGRGGTLYLRGRDGHDGDGREGMVITVADTGMGMSETTRAKVFEAFYTTKGIGGTGLGLWISREIVQRHRGSLMLRSSQQSEPSGSVFRLFLPIDGLGKNGTGPGEGA